QEIVASVKRVTDIMGEISAASEEQSSGIDQVNLAVTQMDETTQQNAALVEQAAAAAGSLEEQARQLAQAVSVFKLRAGADVIDVTAQPVAERVQPRRVASKPDARSEPTAKETGQVKKPARQLAAPAAPPAKSPSTKPKAAASDDKDDWESF
ncbi:MAG: hypothetical protein ACTHJ1_16530, partial [Bordetella sp.]